MGAARLKLFGKLHTIRTGLGLPTELEVEIAPEGRTASEILAELGLPADAVEGVFVNHKVYPVSRTVMPGDEIAFVPKGVPGPHRFTLGLFAAGKNEGRD